MHKIAPVWKWVLILLLAIGAIATAFHFDQAARQWVATHGNRHAKQVMRLASRYGDWPEHVALGLLLIATAWFKGSKPWMRIFTAMIVACALAGISARVVKIAAGRARPNVHAEAAWNGPKFSARYHAFPSGHTAASTAFFATLAFASWRIGAGFLVIPLLIGFSRMYVAAHYLSDVVAAAIIGAVCAWVVTRWNRLQIENRDSRIEN